MEVNFLITLSTYVTEDENVQCAKFMINFIASTHLQAFPWFIKRLHEVCSFHKRTMPCKHLFL